MSTIDHLVKCLLRYVIKKHIIFQISIEKKKKLTVKLMQNNVENINRIEKIEINYSDTLASQIWPPVHSSEGIYSVIFGAFFINKI